MNDGPEVSVMMSGGTGGCCLWALWQISNMMASATSVTI